MAEELAVRSGEVTEMDAYQQALALQRSPDIVMGEAAKAAAALKSVLDSKPKPVMMNGERYLEFEDWMLCGRFYGYTAKEDGDPEFVTMGEAQGFKASAVVLNRHGQVVSRATAYCMNDEDKWSTRTKYAYCYVLKDGSVSVDDPGASNMQWEDNPSKPGKQRPVKVKTKIGDEKVPLFQLSSMAQTRACSKALRNVLAWVVVLAGYKPTPAEELQLDRELPAHEQASEAPHSEQIQKPEAPQQNAPVPQQAPPRQSNGPSSVLISEPQQKRLYAISKKAGWSDEELKKALLGKFGFRSSKEIPRGKYEDICAYFEAGGDAPTAHGDEPPDTECPF